VNQQYGYRKVTVSLSRRLIRCTKIRAIWLVNPLFLRFFAPFCGGKSSEIFNAFALTAAKIILAKAAREATFAANESCRETSEFRQITAFCGAFSLSAFQFSAFQFYPNPPFPPQPPFPRPPVFAKASTGRPV